MRVKTFEYFDKERDWCLQATSFDKLTLLVGASGVGKTQILKAIDSLGKIAKGKTFAGVEWKVAFTSLHGTEFIWQGKFETKEASHGILGRTREQLDAMPAYIAYEQIYKNGTLAVERKKDETVLNGEPIIKLARDKSLLQHLEEGFIREMKESLNQIEFVDYFGQEPSIPVNAFTDAQFFSSVDFGLYKDVKALRETHFSIPLKLRIAWTCKLTVFRTIVDRFIDIFPFVERVEFQKNREYNQFLSLCLREEGSSTWVSQSQISAGMYRVLMQLSALHLSANGTVFLIDEFENSLGTNCIDELTNDMLQQRRSLQFIITSHHPYIINAINFKHWKIVTRRAGVVKTHNADEFALGKSKHTAFMQLLQLDEFQKGTEVA